MGRLPFNARQSRSEPDPPKTDGERPIPVRVLAGMIDDAIRTGLPTRVIVEGEVSGFRERTHWYFDLKDADATVSCVVFASSAAKLARFRDGDRVVARGRVDFYAKAGKVSLIATSVRRSGEGEQDAALRRLVEELRGLGWLDPERKRPLPPFPRRVGVVTSRSAAALQDVLTTLAARCPMLPVLLADSRVQGDAAIPEIAARIRELSARSDELGIDVIVVTRGGGSAEDLAAFNDREVARAIFESRVPVVAAIGHETDTTIAELVADVRAATPTQAAVMVSPDREAVLELIDAHASRLRFAARRHLSALSREHASQEARLARQHPRRRLEAEARSLVENARRFRSATQHGIASQMRRLDRAEIRLNACRPDRAMARLHARQNARLAEDTSRLKSALRARLLASARRLNAAARELQAVGPMEVLRRGYSVTLGPDGSVVRSVGDAPKGATIETRLADGSVSSVVGGTPNRARAPKSKRPDPAQLDLFGRRE